MKKEIDFSRGVRGQYAGQRLRIVGDEQSSERKIGDRCYTVTLPGGIEFNVYAPNKTGARQAALAYFGRGRLPKGAKITPAIAPSVVSAQVTAIGAETVVVLPKRVLRKLKVQAGDALFFVDTPTGIELVAKPILADSLKKSA